MNFKYTIYSYVVRENNTALGSARVSYRSLCYLLNAAVVRHKYTYNSTQHTSPEERFYMFSHYLDYLLKSEKITLCPLLNVSIKDSLIIRLLYTLI